MVVDLLAIESIKPSSLTYIILLSSKVISPVIKVVNEVNNYDLIFIVMLPLFSCLLCSDNSLPPCIQSLILSLVLLLHTQ